MFNLSLRGTHPVCMAACCHATRNLSKAIKQKFHNGLQNNVKLRDNTGSGMILPASRWQAPPSLRIGCSHPSGGQSARLPPTPLRANEAPSRHTTLSRKMSSNQASRRYWRQITAYLPCTNLPIRHDFTASKLHSTSQALLWQEGGQSRLYYCRG